MIGEFLPLHILLVWVAILSELLQDFAAELEDKSCSKNIR